MHEDINGSEKVHKIERGIRHGYIFSTDLFGRYSEDFQIVLEVLSGFCLGGYIINEMGYADDNVSMAGTE